MFDISSEGFNSAQVCSTVFYMLQADLLLVFYVHEAGTAYVIFSTWMWPENQVSRVPGEVEHQKTPFVMLYMHLVYRLHE